MKQLCQTLRAVLLIGILTMEVLASSNTGDYCQSNCGNIEIYCRDATTFTLRVTLGHGFGLILDKSLHCPTGYYCQEDDEYPCVSYQTTPPINEYTSECSPVATQIITEFDIETTTNWISSSEISTKASPEDSSTQIITKPEEITTTILYPTTELATDLNTNDVTTTDFSDYTTTEIDVEVTQDTTSYITIIDEEITEHNTITFSEITTIGSTVEQTADCTEVSTEQATTQLPVTTSTIRDTPVTTEIPTEITAEFADSTEEIQSTTELYTIEDETSLPPLTQTISTTTSSLVESTTADNIGEWTLTPITSESGTTLNTSEDSEPTSSTTEISDNNTTTLKPSSIENSTEGIEYTFTEQIITTVPFTEEISLEVTSSSETRNTGSGTTKIQSSVITIAPIEGTTLNTATEVPTTTRTSEITTTRAPPTKTTIAAVVPPITTPRPVLQPVCHRDGYHRATACHQYWQCVRPYWWAWWFEAVLKTCSPGRFFSTVLQPCNYPPNVYCYF